MTIEEFDALTEGSQIDGRNHGYGIVERNREALIIRWLRDGSSTYQLSLLRSLWGSWSASPMAHWFILEPPRRLRCAVCGASTTGRQWHNQDTGWGICNESVEFLRQKHSFTEEQIRDLYGIEGIHFDVPSPTAVTAA